jgi:hypothetical protein
MFSSIITQLHSSKKPCYGVRIGHEFSNLGNLKPHVLGDFRCEEVPHGFLLLIAPWDISRHFIDETNCVHVGIKKMKNDRDLMSPNPAVALDRLLRHCDPSHRDATSVTILIQKEVKENDYQGSIVMDTTLLALENVLRANSDDVDFQAQKKELLREWSNAGVAKVEGQVIEFEMYQITCRKVDDKYVLLDARGADASEESAGAGGAGAGGAGGGGAECSVTAGDDIGKGATSEYDVYAQTKYDSSVGGMGCPLNASEETIISIGNFARNRRLVNITVQKNSLEAAGVDDSCEHIYSWTNTASVMCCRGYKLHQVRLRGAWLTVGETNDHLHEYGASECVENCDITTGRKGFVDIVFGDANKPFSHSPTDKNGCLYFKGTGSFDFGIAKICGKCTRVDPLDFKRLEENADGLIQEIRKKWELAVEHNQSMREAFAQKNNGPEKDVGKGDASTINCERSQKTAEQVKADLSSNSSEAVDKVDKSFPECISKSVFTKTGATGGAHTTFEYDDDDDSTCDDDSDDSNG